MRKYALNLKGGGQKPKSIAYYENRYLHMHTHFFALGTISDHFIWHWYMTYLGIVQKYGEGIGAFNKPELEGVVDGRCPSLDSSPLSLRAS